MTPVYRLRRPQTNAWSPAAPYLPPELIERNGIHVVPLYVVFGGDSTVPEVEITDYPAFFEELRSAGRSHNLQPSVGDFTAVFEPLLADGGEVVSVHISGGCPARLRRRARPGGAPVATAAAESASRWWTRPPRPAASASWCWRPPRPRATERTRQGGGAAHGRGPRGAEALVRDRHARVPQARRAHRGGQRVDRLHAEGEADPRGGERDDPVERVRTSWPSSGWSSTRKGARSPAPTLVGAAHQRTGPVRGSWTARRSTGTGPRSSARSDRSSRPTRARVARHRRAAQPVRGVADRSVPGGANTALMINVRDIVRIVLMVVCVVVRCTSWLLRRPIGWLLAAGLPGRGALAARQLARRRMKRGFAIAHLPRPAAGPGPADRAIVPPLIAEANNFADHVPSLRGRRHELRRGKRDAAQPERGLRHHQQVQKEAEKLPSRLGGAAGTLRDIGLGIVNSLFALLTILVMTGFLLGSGRQWTDQIITRAHPHSASGCRRSLDNISSAVSGYVAGRSRSPSSPAWRRPSC